MTERAWRLAEHRQEWHRQASGFALGKTALGELGGINGLQDQGSFALFVVIKMQQHCWDVAGGELGQTGQTPQSSNAALLHNVPPLPVAQGNEVWFGFCHVLWLLKLSCFCSPVGVLAWVLVAPANNDFSCSEGIFRHNSY